jgi:biopolymer transport protein ExbD
MTEPDRVDQGRLRALRNFFEQHSERRRHEVKSDINVTPLVDVVLVLLIIFMVVTPLIASGVAVDLPRTAHHARKPDDGKDIIISVTQDKRIYLGAKRLARVEDIGPAIAAAKRTSPEKTIFVKGDARAPYGALRQVMLELHKSEIDDVVLGTEELPKAE